IGDSPCCLPYLLNERQENAIKRAGWAGVEVVSVKVRYGPRPLAAHVVGYLGKIDSVSEWRTLNQGEKRYVFNGFVGKAGCEHFYEPVLKGEIPCAVAGLYHDARGKTLSGLGVRVQKQADRKRADLVLTVDARIQQAVEDEMDKRVPQGAVVVLEAGSGDILAVASRPAFNPSALRSTGNPLRKEVFFDRAFAPCPPGSIFKIVVGAAALERGLVGPETRLTCRGDSGPFVRCWYTPGHGSLTFEQAFAHSCNPAFAVVGLTLGKARLLDFCRAFALEDRSAVGFPLPRDPRQDFSRYLRPHNLVNVSIGQGPVLMTPVQVAAVVNTIVNNGVYVKPRLVKGFRWQNREEALPRDPGRRIFSPATAAKLRELMALSTRAGTGRPGYLEGLGSAGKTGTAEANTKTVHTWFAGYAPLNCPRYVIVVMIDGGQSGGQSAAPVFKEIASKLLS
ncbi:MAG: penicillin-binding protein 2, partial [Firmicutes bacterium]|nr:penicillin-binding protein 2 [Bacillota bacterium]